MESEINGPKACIFSKLCDIPSTLNTCVNCCDQENKITKMTTEYVFLVNFSVAFCEGRKQSPKRFMFR